MGNDIQTIQNLIYEIRGQRVMLDRDLAAMYGVETRRLNEQVKRNIERFPEDFMFQLTKGEFEILKSQIATFNTSDNQLLLEDSLRSRSQNAILNKGRGSNIKYLPYAFTENGVAMLSSVLRSPLAIQVNIGIMRAFTEFRRIASTLALPNPSADIAQLRKDFEELKLDIQDILHDQNDINEETRAQLDAINDALTQLQGQRPTPALPEIGYTAIQKQREKAENYPPHLTNLNNPLTFRTNHIALLHSASRRMSRALSCLCLIISTFFFASCEDYDDAPHRIMQEYLAESRGPSLPTGAGEHPSGAAACPHPD